jgi:hypothetical protein
MGVTVSLPLFGAPCHELEEAVGSRQLRELADALRERILAAADTLDRLSADGWKAEPAMFELLLAHPRVATQEEAEKRLRAIGINPEALMIVEDVEEEEIVDT